MSPTPEADSLPTIAVVGGTGALGSGLAAGWARAGYAVVIGSRSKERAEASAQALSAGLPPGRITGDDQRGAVRRGEIVVVTVPYAAHEETLAHVGDLLPGKILVDTTVPLRPPAVDRVQLPPAGSAVVEGRLALPAGVDVVSAFQNVSATHLRHGGPVACDVLVAGDDERAREAVVGLARALGLRAWHAGPLANSAAAEALVSVLLHVNRRYGIVGAGIRITTGDGAGEPR